MITSITRVKSNCAALYKALICPSAQLTAAPRDRKAELRYFG